MRDEALQEQAEEMVNTLRNYVQAYPESVWPTPPDHLRAKNAAAADVMRQLALPTMARAAEVIERLLDNADPVGEFIGGSESGDPGWAATAEGFRHNVDSADSDGDTIEPNRIHLQGSEPNDQSPTPPR